MPNSLIDLRDWPSSEIKKLIDLSFSIEKESTKVSKSSKLVGLLFFESSTRTRISFEVACSRENHQSFLVSTAAGTSMEKGESLRDTLDNILAMNPDLIVIRSNQDFDQKDYFQNLKIPVISAGWGQLSHPTQALLDIRSLIKNGLAIEQIKLVIIGDIKHSRVAHSHLALSEKLGYQVAVLGSDSMMSNDSFKRLHSMEEAFEWGNVLMALRYQKERHDSSTQDYDYEKFQITKKKLEQWPSEGFLMHPGPINYGVEITEDTRDYKKNLILSQAESGVWIRRAALRYLLKDLT